MESVSIDIINKIIDIVKSGGGTVYEQPGYINFCGVRNYICDNTFNDILFIYWKDGDTFKGCQTTGFTTKPGKTKVLGLLRNGQLDPDRHEDGVAIVKEGWHQDVWEIGSHRGEYDALVQRGNISITRDATQYKYTPVLVDILTYELTYVLRITGNTIEGSNFGINLHRSKENGKSTLVDGWSAGCQVFASSSEFDEMMNMARNAKTAGQEKFSYFLTNINTYREQFDYEHSRYNINANVTQGQRTQGQSTQEGQQESQVRTTDEVSGLSNYGSDEETSDSTTTSNAANQEAEVSNVIGGFISIPLLFGEDKLFADDNNNRYIDMPSEDILTIQYTNPNPKLKIAEIDSESRCVTNSGVVPKRIAYHVPVVCINDFMIPQTNITNFCLDYSSFLPQVMVEFVDMKNDMLSTNIPKPGSYIKVYIGGYGDDEYYKPIRQDFVITNISKTNKTGGEYQNYRNSSNPIKYKFTGILNVPLGFRKIGISYGNVNATKALFKISKHVGLGFATNFEMNNNIDQMNWKNTQNKSYFDFMKDITNHSCYSPFTFFTSFIDQYYVFNYVECHRLLSHGGKKEDLPQMIYNCILPDMDEKKDDNSNSGEQQDNNLINENEKQLIDYYFLTNDDTYKGWTNYIEEYYEINEGYSSMSDGYSKNIEYTSKTGYLNYKKFKFKIIPIDNLHRDNDRNIDMNEIPQIEDSLSLSEKLNKIKDIYIPLNLRQTTDPTYIENINENNGYNNPSLIGSYVDLGEHNLGSRGGGNIFFAYPYASVQNDFQMKNLKKCGLSVRLQNYNPAITKFSRIWVDIYDMNQNSLTQIRRNEDIDELTIDNSVGNNSLKEALKKKNDDIIEVEDEKVNDNEYRVYNRSLSGWYVVTDMKISYNTVKDFKGTTYKKLQTQLILNRIEYKPTFYTEYKNARKAIKKYSNDNTSSKLYELYELQN